MTDTNPARPADDPSATFFRAGGRNRFTAREAAVAAVTRIAERYIRVTVSGPDFADFTSGGPSDHVKLFFPDAETGELVAPVAAGPGEDGIVRPNRASISRDFTPLNPSADGIDLDFLLHDDPGPAATWATHAQVGDRLVVVGPRGSRAATQNAPRVLLVVDGTSLPAAGRWLAEVPASTRVDVIADVEEDVDWVSEYFATAHGRVPDSLVSGANDLATAVRAANVDASTYVFAAGEASSLVDPRRYLRHELALPRAQYAVSGYWRRGVAAFDHHAPIDPSDPDD